MATGFFGLFIRKKRPIPPLAQLIEQAKQDWRNAQHLFRTSPADNDMIDYAIYMIQASEKRYVYLLKQARQEGVEYSPFRSVES